MDGTTMTATAYPHIDLRPDGVPIIAGTRTKVVLVVMDWLEAGGHLDELYRAYPGLTPGQLHSALAYYYDHQQAFDSEIERRRSSADTLWSALEDTSFLARLERGRPE